MEFLWVILITIILGIIMIYNIIIRNKKRVEQAKSGIDIYLNQRFDLIPNLVEVVKGYAQYEAEILRKTTELRTRYIEYKDDLEVKDKLDRHINSILVTMEEYPELKTSEQFLKLQRNLLKMESQLQAARRIYNAEVTSYNTKIKMIPLNIIAKIFGFKEEKLFEIEEGKEGNIEIDMGNKE